jgi:hypothetical protein
LDEVNLAWDQSRRRKDPGVTCRRSQNGDDVGGGVVFVNVEASMHRYHVLDEFIRNIENLLVRLFMIRGYSPDKLTVRETMDAELD